MRENILRNNRRDSESLGFPFLSPFPRPGLPFVGGVWIGIVVTICQTRLLDAASRWLQTCLISAAIPDNGVENFITPARVIARAGGEGKGGIVKRSRAALRSEADLISRLCAKIPSTDIYYAKIVGEYCAKTGRFIILISVKRAITAY